MNLLEVMAYVGSMFVLYCAVIGAWVILRWGTTGIGMLWARRKEFDVAVREDLELRLGRYPVEKG